MSAMQDNYRRSRKRRRKRPTGLLIFAVIFICIVGFAGYYIGKELLPNFESIAYYTFHSELSRNELRVVLNDEDLDMENSPMIQEDTVYLPVDFIKKYADEYIFWDHVADRLTITTYNTVIRMNTEELTYYVNDMPMTLNLPLYKLDGVAYLPDKLIYELYGIELDYVQEYNKIIIDYGVENIYKGEVSSKKTNVRYDADKKSPIMEKLEQGTSLTLFSDSGDFTRVRLEDGRLGYIASKDIVEKETISIPLRVKEEPVSSANLIDGKINLVWDPVSTVEASSNAGRRSAAEGLNVISPTWFEFDYDALNGDLISIADKGYVDWAHRNGYQVWGLFRDFRNTDSYNNNEVLLTSTEYREKIIRQLLAYISLYGLDGINIDFEFISEEVAPYFLQFLRELAPYMREQGAVLSVDVYVPKPWSMHYRRDEIAKAADYVCVMTYDEHTDASDYGPVASLGFVEEGIVEILKEVPKEKLIMGLPFYNRVWAETEQDGQVSYSRSHYEADYTHKMFKDNGAEFVWMKEEGYYYGEYTVSDGKANTTYRVWLENENSIEEKLKLFQKYDLAGVAGWSKYFENNSFWKLIAEYLS